MEPMPHLVVVLPGISGSVLAKKGVDIWAPSPTAFFRGIRSLGATLQSLCLDQDSATNHDLGDGVTAPRLIPDVHLIPGFFKIDGYTGLCNALQSQFELVDAEENEGGNYLKFAYDWRRDNRYTALVLREKVDRCLQALRRTNP